VAPETCRDAGGVTECARSLNVTDVATAAEWSGRRVDLAVSSGVRIAAPGLDLSGGRVWGSASAALWVSPTVAVAGAFGALPADPIRQLPARRVAQAGLRLRAAPRVRRDPTLAPPAGPAPAAAPLTVGPERGGLRRLRVGVPGAARVEVMGDCTGWRPVDLAPQPDGSWATELPLAAGVYHLQLRVDGGPWRPPAGLPAVPDGFAGTVGVLVVQPDR
jgi:hypothetical protein